MKYFRFLLFPIALLYDVITSVRNVLFDKGVLRETSFPIPILVVGNLSVGGTGKTPQIEYLIRLLIKTYPIAVLSRGYGRKTRGFLRVEDAHTARDVGDEPLQFFKKFSGLCVAVDGDRRNGINKLLEATKPPEVILLDDAYQHRKVRAGFSILLTTYEQLFVDDFLLPTGNLRESRRGARRASVMIVTKCPENLKEEEQQEIKEKLQVQKEQQVFFTTISYTSQLQGVPEKSRTIDTLTEDEVLLVTGIADPAPLQKHLRALGVSYTHLRFPDHHSFTRRDVETIQKRFAQFSSPKKTLLTTEKDYVRLRDKMGDIPLYYVEISSAFLNEQALFDRQVLSFVSGKLAGK